MYQLDTAFLNRIDVFFDRCKEVADYMTDHPETGLQNPLAVSRICAMLEKEGYAITAPCRGVESSFLAVDKKRLDDNGPRAVFMCETDALPEIGHACGHSISSAISLLAALAIRDAYPDLPIRIDIMGTPGEEYPGGKVYLADAGAFDGYEFAAMAHLSDVNMPDTTALASNDHYITFHGRSAHASGNPCAGINALNAARLFMDAMDMWRQHIPRNSQIHGIVVKGGYIPSAVPDLVELNYYYRAQTLKELEDLNQKAIKSMQGAALATDATVEWVQQYETYADVFQNPVSRKAVTEIFDAMGESYTFKDVPAGSSDVGNVDQHTPIFHPYICASGGATVPNHDLAFTKLMKSETGYAALRNGAIVLGSIGLRMALEPELLAEIQRRHKEYRGL